MTKEEMLTRHIKDLSDILSMIDEGWDIKDIEINIRAWEESLCLEHQDFLDQE